MEVSIPLLRLPLLPYSFVLPWRPRRLLALWARRPKRSWEFEAAAWVEVALLIGATVVMVAAEQRLRP